MRNTNAIEDRIALLLAAFCFSKISFFNQRERSRGKKIQPQREMIYLEVQSPLGAIRFRTRDALDGVVRGDKGDSRIVTTKTIRCENIGGLQRLVTTAASNLSVRAQPRPEPDDGCVQ
ncbi:hypothetical protein [Bradyrhizobium sp. UFLA05-112]